MLLVRRIGAGKLGSSAKAGYELSEARKQIRGEREWQDWLDAEFGWDERTAKRYMQIASSFQFAGTRMPSSDETMDISFNALYVLSAPDVPQSTREKAVDRSAGRACARA